MNTKGYRWCAVPMCRSTSISTRHKVFVHVPNKKIIRDTWLKLARRNPNDVLTTSTLYFCEDHFDLPNDMENYMQYHLMGSVAQVRMKPGCMPKKFVCQLDNKKTKRRCRATKRKVLVLEDCDKNSKESIVTDQSSTKEIASDRLAQQILVEELQITPRVLNKSIQVHIRKKFRSKASQTQINSLIQMTSPLKSILHSKSTSPLKMKHGVHKNGENVDACHICGTDFKGGSVYNCVQCACRLCGACERDGAHDQHYVLRAPPGAKHEVEMVMRRVREALGARGPEQPEPVVGDGDAGAVGELALKTEIEVHDHDVSHIIVKTETDWEDADPLTRGPPEPDPSGGTLAPLPHTLDPRKYEPGTSAMETLVDEVKVIIKAEYDEDTDSAPLDHDYDYRPHSPSAGLETLVKQEEDPLDTRPKKRRRKKTKKMDL